MKYNKLLLALALSLTLTGCGAITDESNITSTPIDSNFKTSSRIEKYTHEEMALKTRIDELNKEYRNLVDQKLELLSDIAELKKIYAELKYSYLSLLEDYTIEEENN